MIKIYPVFRSQRFLQLISTFVTYVWQEHSSKIYCILLWSLIKTSDWFCIQHCLNIYHI